MMVQRLPVIAVFTFDFATLPSIVPPKRRSARFPAIGAVDLKGKGIRVNAVGPGVIPTPDYHTSLGMTEQQLDDYILACVRARRDRKNIAGRPAGDKVTDRWRTPCLCYHAAQGLLVTKKAAVRIFDHSKRPAQEQPVAGLRADTATG
jgi:NAD(P)-dependent dehydrogenase (short-subunit alcohol dehydrogenase family)